VTQHSTEAADADGTAVDVTRSRTGGRFWQTGQDRLELRITGSKACTWDVEYLNGSDCSILQSPVFANLLGTNVVTPPPERFWRIGILGLFFDRKFGSSLRVGFSLLFYGADVLRIGTVILRSQLHKRIGDKKNAGCRAWCRGRA